MNRYIVVLIIYFTCYTCGLSQTNRDSHYKFGITSEKQGTVELAKYIDAEKAFSEEEKSDYISTIGKSYKETTFASEVLYEGSKTLAGDKSIHIPHTAIIKGKKYKVTSIAENAFRELTKLSVVEISSTVDSIKGSAFYGCSSLMRIKLGSSVKFINGEAFSHCYNLCKIEIDKNNKYLKTIENVLYSKDGSILIYAPSHMDRDEFTVPSHVRHIGKSAFSSSKLKKIIISEGVQTLAEAAFGWNKSLLSITLPSTLRSIGKNAFIWSGIRTLMLPDGIVDIGEQAFSHSRNLQIVYFGSSLRSIGERAFEYCALTELSLPTNVSSIGENAFIINPLRQIEVAKGNKHYCSKDGVLFNNRLDTLVLYPVAKARSYTVPEGVTTIKKCAFDFEFLEEYDILNQLTLPVSLNTIEDFAFVSCQNLKEIVLPSNVKKIGVCGLFCSALEAVVIKGTMPVLSKNAVKKSTVFYLSDDYISEACRKYPLYSIKAISEKVSSYYCSLNDMVFHLMGSIENDKSLWEIKENDVEEALKSIGAHSMIKEKEHVYEKSLPFRYKDKKLNLSFAVQNSKAIFDRDTRLRCVDYVISTNRNYHDLTESVANQLIDMGFRLVKGDYGAMVRKNNTIVTIIPDPTSENVFITFFDYANLNNKKDLDEVNELIDSF